MAQKWFYTRDGKTKNGPLSSSQFQALAKSGQLLPTDMVWREGLSKWTPASKVKGLFAKPPMITAAPPLPAPTAVLVQQPPKTDTVKAVEPIPTQESPVTKAEVKKWYNADLAKNNWVRLGVAIIVIAIGVLRIVNWNSKRSVSGPQGGTITFAENIDPKTMKTTREGTRFTTGVIWIIVRGKKPFGDTKLIFYGREHGTEMWAVAGEETVDPTWDTAVWKDVIDEPGKVDIKVMTGKGELVAQSTLEIVRR